MAVREAAETTTTTLILGIGGGPASGAHEIGSCRFESGCNGKSDGKRGRNFTMHYHLFTSWIHQHILIVESSSAWCTFDFKVHVRHCLTS